MTIEKGPHLIPDYDPLLELLTQRYPDCARCSLGCHGDDPPSAMALIQKFDWDALQDLINKVHCDKEALNASSRNPGLSEKLNAKSGVDVEGEQTFDAAQFAERSYLTFWYQSGLWRTCLMRSIHGCLNAIVLIAIERGGAEYVSYLLRWLNDSIVASTKTPASVYVSHHAQRTLDDCLDSSLRFWIEAAQLHDRAVANDLDTNVAWPALLQAHFYLGMAWGPAFESGVKARKKRYLDARQLEEALEDELIRCAPNQFATREEAYEHLANLPSLQVFNDSENRLANRIKYVTQRKGTAIRANKVKQYLNLVCKPTTKGRPRKVTP